jgi:hypothetical protein
VGYSNWDALDVVSSSIPPYIQQRICTWGRLPAEGMENLASWHWRLKLFNTIALANKTNITFWTR